MLDSNIISNGVFPLNFVFGSTPSSINSLINAGFKFRKALANFFYFHKLNMIFVCKIYTT